MKEGNHMIDLPQPELDNELQCKHEAPVAEDVIDFSVFSVTLEITCGDCGHTGTMTMYANDENAEIEWDEE